MYREREMERERERETYAATWHPTIRPGGQPASECLLRIATVPSDALHSAKGGAVETGCSDLYDVMY